MNPDGWNSVCPVLSTITLTNVEYSGLTTCPAGDGSAYQYVQVTVKDSDGDPVEGIPADEFDFSVFPLFGTRFFNVLTCTFIPVDPVTDENGEIRFTIQGDTSIIGDINITCAVMDVLLDDIDTLSCISSDRNVNGIIDLPDFAFFAQEGYHNQNPLCDYDWDGAVTLVDFAMFASHWGHNHP